MVMPSPFERLLQDVAQQANRDPAGAYARLDDLFGKSLTESDVLQLGALSVHLGGAGLGRWEETARFQRQLLQHPAITAGGPAARSLWRGLAVLLQCGGDKAESEKAVATGVTTPAERCRLVIMTAQTLAARGRPLDAIPYLNQCADLCREVPAGDDIIVQAAMISTNLARIAEGQLRQAVDLLLAASETASVAWGRQGEWRNHHKALYHQGCAFLLAANPGLALGVVQMMMALEDANDAGPADGFFTACLACRAQVIRGQIKVAAGALEACQDFARRVGEQPESKQIQLTLQDLERYVASMRNS